MTQFEELQETLAVFTYSLYMKYDMSEIDAAVLIDTVKMFAAEYAALLEAGEVAEPYEKNFAKGLDAMNEFLENEEV